MKALDDALHPTRFLVLDTARAMLSMIRIGKARALLQQRGPFHKPIKQVIAAGK